MVAWWLVPAALVCGVLFGVLICAVCAYGKTNDDGRRWWDE